MEILNKEELDAFFYKCMSKNHTLHAVKGEVRTKTEIESRINISWVCNETGEIFNIEYI